MDIPGELKSRTESPYWGASISVKGETRSPVKLELSPTTMATQRNRQNRGGDRRNGQDLEELAMWNSSQEEIRSITRLLARAEECREEIIEKEADFKNRAPASM